MTAPPRMIIRTITTDTSNAMIIDLAALPVIPFAARSSRPLRVEEVAVAAKLSSLTPVEARLLAVLEADGGWLDRRAIMRRYNASDKVQAVHVNVLHRLVAWGFVEAEQRRNPKGRVAYYYRYIPRP